MLDQLFDAYGKIGVERIKQALEQVRATGKTIESVKYETSQDGNNHRLVIKARPYTSAIEEGIRPTTKGVSREMIESLTEYAIARGMDKPESAAWGIAKKIQREGDRTYKSGGRDIYSSVAIQVTKELKKEVLKDFKIRSTQFIKNTWR